MRSLSLHYSAVSSSRRSLAQQMLSALSIAGVICSCSIAHAGDAAAPEGASIRVADASADHSAALGTITVTARRREENAQDVPIPIAAIGGDTLEKAGQFRLEDLNQQLPSTNVFVQNPRQSSFAVRGLGNNPANDALESSVGLYLDNVYLGRPGMANLDLIDIDQITLLRGPQGTLFGKNTTAGVLNITTREPGFTPGGSVEGTYGNDDYYQVRGAITGPITDTLAGRLSAAKSYRDGYVDQPLRNKELNQSDRTGVRGQLLWNATDELQLRFIGDYNTEESDCCAGVLKTIGANNGAAYLAQIARTGATFQFDPNFRTIWTNGNAHMSVKQGGGSVEANWKTDAGTLTSISAYRFWDFAPDNDADGVSLNAIINAAQDVKDKQWSQELRWASPSGQTVDYVSGFYYFYQSQHNKLFTQYGPDAGIWFGVPQFINGYTQTNQSLYTRSAALFAQATWNISDQFSLTGGLRGTREQKDTTVDRLAPTGPNPGIALRLPAYNSGDLTRTDNNLSALLSAGYKFTPDTLLYASVSRGAKSGGINPSVPPTVAGGLPPNQPLFIDPEKATDYEFGIKTNLLSNKLQLNANLFWTDVDDYQSTLLGQFAGTGVSTQILSNIGSVRTRGVEFEIAARPVEGLNLSLTGSFNDAKYTDYKNGPCAAEKPQLPACDLTGERIYLTPKWVINPGVDYELPVGSLTAFSYVGYSWRSKYFGSADSSSLAELSSYGLLNARVGLRGALSGKQQWTATLWANNVLDKVYFESLARGSFGEYAGMTGLPRTYGATIRYDF